MTVKIVTDSVADLPPQVVEELGITVVPLQIRFGNEVFRDGIDITLDEFYRRLLESMILPVTSVPTPASYYEVYDSLAEETDRIAVITVTSRLSGTYDVAHQSVGMMKRDCQVEVVDSRLATMAQGFVVMKAARAANDGASLKEVLSVIRENIPRAGFQAAFDTLEFLRRGGRIGHAQAFLGTKLHIKPIITLKDGLVEPVTKVRSKAKAAEHLYEYACSFSNIEELALETTGEPEEAEALIDKLSTLVPRDKIYRSGMTPVIGTHTGPGLLLVAVLGDK